MTTDQAMTALAAALGGGLLARLLARLRLAAPPRSLMRVNFRGREVPAVLGGPLVIAGLSVTAVVAMAGASGWEPGRVGRTGLAVALAAGIMMVAGSFDDHRGDEGDRGFRGHLAAAGRARLTGGLVKIAAGGLAGAATAALVSPGLVHAGLTVAAVALAANLANLTDRAPGRALKVALVPAAVLAVAGDPAWAIGAAGLAGAAAALAPLDLTERAMLGDAGSNPLGAALGVGLAASAEGAGLAAGVAVLLALNLVSEVVSFSAVIEKTRWLRAVDRWGRET